MNNQLKNEYQPNYVSPPGETLADLLEERGMSQSELAERTGRPTKTINEIVKGKAAITSETAIQLERVLGVPAEFWSTREAQYRQYLAVASEQERLEKKIAWAKSFPIKEMSKFGWIADIGKDSALQVIQILNFFGVATPEQWESGWTHHRLSFRRSAKLQTKLEPTSAWLRKGEIEATSVNAADFNEGLLRERIPTLRALTLVGDPKEFIPSLQKQCAEFGVIVVFIRPLKGVPVCGAARWLSPTKALIQLSVRYKFNDIMWFTFFHELAHILLHKKKDIFVDLSDFGGKDSVVEETEANEFAASTLIPPEVFQEWLSTIGHITKESVRDFARKIGICAGIVVGRLQHMDRVPPSHLNDLKLRYSWPE